MKKQFRGNLKRQFNEGTLSEGNVPFKVYKRNKLKRNKPKTKWEKIKDWFKEIFNK